MKLMLSNTCKNKVCYAHVLKKLTMLEKLSHWVLAGLYRAMGDMRLWVTGPWMLHGHYCGKLDRLG